MLKDHALLSGGRNVEKKHSKGAHALGYAYLCMQRDEPSDRSSPLTGPALPWDLPFNGIGPPTGSSIPPTGSSLPRDHSFSRINLPTGSTPPPHGIDRCL